jgi:hypothetical protein
MDVNAQTSRKLTVRQAAFIGVGAMVGAGIFSLLGAAGEVVGAAVWLSFLIAGGIALLQGYSLRSSAPGTLGGRPARVRRARTRQRTCHRHHRVADPGCERQRHRHGRGLVRKLRQRRPH